MNVFDVGRSGKSEDRCTHLGSVNELTGQHKVTGCNLLLQASYSAKCYDSFDTQALESRNVGPRRNGGRRDLVVDAMTSDEGNLFA